MGHTASSCDLLTKANWDPKVHASIDWVNTTVERQKETLLRLVHISCLAEFGFVRSTWYG